MAKVKTFAVGSKVRLTGSFLRSTGQFAGPEGQARWIVQACACRMCATGRFIRTDQQKSAESLRDYTAEELASEPALYFRHIASANLEKAR
jgi:hypothetical protein